MSHAHRVLTWEGCSNVRDLGGLTTISGSQTHWRAIIRGDHPSKLTAAGWQALYDYGVRTVIELRTAGQNEAVDDHAPRPTALTTHYIEIEDLAATDFVEQWVNTDLWCTPLYYADALQRWPQRHAAVVKAIAQAEPGGIFFHCRRGHDRTGIISMLLLALAEVELQHIVEDYELSHDADRTAILNQRNTTLTEVFNSILTDFDAPAYLRAAGLSLSEIQAAKAHLVE